MKIQYLHIDYVPEDGWVLSIMGRLLNSPNPRLRKAFDEWSDTPLKELGFAITTRIHMLGRCVRRLNAHVAELREQINKDDEQLGLCLAKSYSFRLPNRELPYELLLDMDSFIFETRSLYEIMGEFLTSLFQLVFNRKITQDGLKSLLSDAGIDTRWTDELKDARILFFHKTAPWLAVQIDQVGKRHNPVLLKRNVITFENPVDFIEFSTLREIFERFVDSASELHRFVLEQIRNAESNSTAA